MSDINRDTVLERLRDSMEYRFTRKIQKKTYRQDKTYQPSHSLIVMLNGWNDLSLLTSVSLVAKSETTFEMQGLEDDAAMIDLTVQQNSQNS